MKVVEETTKVQEETSTTL